MMRKRCKKEAFLDDPMTQAYGVGFEMLSMIDCDCPLCTGQDTAVVVDHLPGGETRLIRILLED